MVTHNEPQQPRWASLTHAAEYFDCSTDTIRRYISSGLLPGYRVPNGKTLKIDLNDLDDLAVRIPSAFRPGGRRLRHQGPR